MERLESLLKMTEIMRTAAATGEFEKVARLKVERDELLCDLAGQDIPSPKLRETLTRLMALDGEIVSFLEQAKAAAAAELRRLHAGRRARQAYGSLGEQDGLA